jgi:hypothetical protein
MPKDEYDPEDPLELVAVEIPSDPNQVLDDIVQEYLFLGWKPAMIQNLFRSPFYGGPHQVYQQLGGDHVRRRINELAEQWKQGWFTSAAHKPGGEGGN